MYRQGQALPPFPEDITRILIRSNPGTFNRLVRSSPRLRTMGYNLQVLREICNQPITFKEIRAYVGNDLKRIQTISIRRPVTNPTDFDSRIEFGVLSENYMEIIVYGYNLDGIHVLSEKQVENKDVLNVLEQYYFPGSYIDNIRLYFNILWKTRKSCRPVLIELTVNLFKQCIGFYENTVAKYLKLNTDLNSMHNIYYYWVEYLNQVITNIFEYTPDDYLKRNQVLWNTLESLARETETILTENPGKIDLNVVIRMSDDIEQLLPEYLTLYSEYLLDSESRN